MRLPSAANFSILTYKIVPRGLSELSAYRCIQTQHKALNKTLLYVMCWLLLRFLRCCSSLQQNHMTAERNRLGGGGAQTDSKSSGEKEKKTLCWRQREQEGGGKKRGLKVFHFKNCGTTARNCCCNQNKPGATTVPGN